jgi:VWFA-related protein
MLEYLSRPVRGTGLLLCALLLAAPSPTYPQSLSDAGFTETIDVALVNLEVWVSDQDGSPVSGLDADAFSLSHDGQEVVISHFSELRDRRPVGTTEDSPNNLDPTAQHFAIVFDLNRLTPMSQKRLAKEIRQFLGDELIAPENVLVLRTDTGLSVESPFGSSADTINAALERLENRVSSSFDSTVGVKEVAQALQDTWTDLNAATGNTSLRTRVNQVTGPSASQRAGLLAGSGDTPAPGAAGPPPTRACDDYVARVEPIVTAWGARELREIQLSLNRLADVSAFLSGLEGPKALLYVSDGLSLSPGIAATSFVRGLCPAFQTDLEVDALPQEIEAAFSEVARRLAANQITLHAIQGSGVQTAVGTTTGQSSSDSRGLRSFHRGHSTSSRQALGLLADQTGGRLIADGPSLNRELEVISSEMGNYYSIAYSPPPTPGRRDHAIELQTRDEALNLRYRRSYSEKTPDQWLTERLESALYLGMVSNSLGIRLAAEPTKPSSGSLQMLPLHIRVPVERLSFLEVDGPPMAKLMIKIMALNASSRTLVITNKNLTLPRPGEEAGKLIDLRVNLELEAGNQTVAIGVRDQASGDASFVSTSMQIEEPNTQS